MASWSANQLTVTQGLQIERLSVRIGLGSLSHSFFSFSLFSFIFSFWSLFQPLMDVYFDFPFANQTTTWFVFHEYSFRIGQSTALSLWSHLHHASTSTYDGHIRPRRSHSMLLIYAPWSPWDPSKWQISLLWHANAGRGASGADSILPSTHGWKDIFGAYSVSDS